MRLEIDSDVCTGHGRCYVRSPNLISPDDEGYPLLVHADGQVPADLEEDARTAARSCPEGAMRLLEAG